MTNERRRDPRIKPVGVTALVRCPSAETPFHFQVEDMSASGLHLGLEEPANRTPGPDEVVDVELWGFRRTVRARGLVVRKTQPRSQTMGIALKLYAFENGDEDFYRSILLQNQ